MSTKDDKKTNPPLSIRFDLELKTKLEKVSQDMDRPKAWIIQEALKYYLSEYSELEQALEKVKNPNSEYIDWEDAKHELLS
jgi:predicted DNA-binding protein